MLDLKSILAGPTIRPRRILLYGTGGIGKSTWAANAPKSIFLPTEEGLDTIDVPRFPRLNSFDEVMEAIGTLYDASTKYETVVLDSLDWTERLIWSAVATAQGKKSIEEIGYAKGYIFALDYWHQILDGFAALRDKGMTIILIAHSGVEKIENPEGDNYDRHAPRLHKKASALCCEWADEVLFASYKLYTRKETETAKKAKGLGTGERLIRTVERPAYVAKNRLDLPEELPLLWDEYAKFLPASKSAGKQKVNGKKGETTNV